MTSIPGMQIPHCAAPSSTKAAWSGCGASGVPSPRTVVTDAPVGLDGQRQARVDRPAVQQDGARAAVAPLAARLDLGRREALAEHPEEGLVRLPPSCGPACRSA